ncbi:MAG TPA: DMT family transporter [Thermoplasmata archaeon]|nr:DMT family transporter [Thermoplasmata archaeon]
MGTASDLLYGLATALGYGSGDFVARQAARRIGHLYVLFYMELFSLVLLVPAAVLLERGFWHWTPMWGYAAALAILNVVASLFLYRAFEYGVLSVVSPVVSTFPAVTAVLAFLFLPDRPTLVAVAGIAAALLGVVLISRAEAHPDNPPAKDARKGLVSAICCFLGYGVFYFALKFLVGDLGAFTAAAYVRVIGVGAIGVTILAGIADVRRLPREFVRPIALVGVLDSAAFVTYNLGVAAGSVAIVGTLSGLFSAVTVGLAAVLLRERLVPVQYGGLAFIFAGIVLMAVA